MNRILGVIEGAAPGPLSILIGGIHGNEAAGIKAINQIFETIENKDIEVSGTLVGLAGNLQAIAKNRRFIDYDLNRCWDNTFIDRIKDKRHSKAEDIELFALNKIIQSYANRRYKGPKILMDLHTTSSEKGNFVVIPQSEATHPIVRSLRQPIVIDLDDYLKGTMLKYFQQKGFISFAFEGGLIGTSEAIDLHVAGLWELLQASGTISPQADDSFLTYGKVLEAYANNLPHFIKVLYHHWIELGDQFVMNAGYENFQPVVRGEEVARDKSGPIVSPMDGLMFLPLYQDSGNDGFFIVQEISVMEPS